MHTTGLTNASSSRRKRLFITAAAAFATYFCMYAFRKPFTAATFEDQTVFGLKLKVTLVIAQLLGYLISKFIGIKVVSEMSRQYRTAAILGLVLVAEAALVGFAIVPTPWKVVMMFINGLPLGMVFGLVLSYLEGRRQTEALSAALCASFIISSGVVKTVGQWLLLHAGVSEFFMPMLAGILFLPPLFLSVYFLHSTPPPDDFDRLLRSERAAMDRAKRQQFLAAYWPGMILLVLVYVAVTVIRTVRDDFGVEIWRDLGVNESPIVFSVTETVVAVVVTGLNALAILIQDNMRAIRVAIGLMAASFIGVAGSAVLYQGGQLTPFLFMVACGIGLYVPYVAYHTTVFERLIAASRRPCNLGFLMYVADAVGYLGYAIVIVFKTWIDSPARILPFFLWTLLCVGSLSIVALLLAGVYFEKRLLHDRVRRMEDSAPTSEELVPME